MIKELKSLGSKFRTGLPITKVEHKELVKELDYIKNSIVTPMYYRNKKGTK
jgi:hypothetical protein